MITAVQSTQLLCFWQIILLYLTRAMCHANVVSTSSFYAAYLQCLKITSISSKLQAGGRHDMPRPGLQRKRAVAALSQACRATPNRPICAIQQAGHTRRLPTGCTQQTSDSIIA